MRNPESIDVGSATSGITPVAPLTNEKRWDALRAITRHHQHVAPMPDPDLREIIEALGLAETPPAADGSRPSHRDVPCPRCHARVGVVCRDDEGLRYTRGHWPRHRAAEAAA